MLQCAVPEAARSSTGRIEVRFGLVKVANLFNQDIQPHIFGDILKRTVSFEARIKT
jgi:hypothetical protein